MVAQPITLTAFEDRLLREIPDANIGDVLRARGLPSRRTETWKWSDLRGAVRDDRAASGPYASDVPAAPLDLEGATILTLKNGMATAPAGVEPKPIVKDGRKVGVTYVVADGLVISQYESGREIDAPIGPGRELEAMAALRPLTSISILPGFSHDVVLRRLSDGAGRHGDNVFVTVGEGATLRLVETHEVEGSPFVNSRTEIEVDATAAVERVVLQPAAPEAVIVHSSIVRLDEEKDGEIARFGQTTLAAGAQLSRHETRLTHLGRSEARIDALYRLDDRLHTDITSHVTFEGEDAVTGQLVKGIGAGHGRGVFQGKFLVRHGAQRTDAQMAHHALLLSNGAHINAKPELEIYADDVECAHGNTVGALDPEAIFYMRQRGLSEESANRLLIDAFGGEVLERIADEELRSKLQEVVSDAGGFHAL